MKLCNSHWVCYDVHYNQISLFWHRLNEKGNGPQDVAFDLKLASLDITSSVCYGFHDDDWTSDQMNLLLKDHDKAMSGLSPFNPINIFPFIKNLPVRLVKEIKDITQVTFTYC